MLFKTIVSCVLLANLSHARPSFPSALELTQQYFTARKSLAAERFFSEDTKVVCHANPLPCTGAYVGYNGAVLLSHRFQQTFEVASVTHEIAACNEAKSLCIVNVKMNGQTKAEGVPFQNLEMVQIFVWNNPQQKLVRIEGQIKNLELVLGSVQPAAQKHFNTLMELVFQTKDNLMAALNNRISPTIVVEIDGAPSNMFKKKKYVGKQQFYELMKEHEELLENLPISTLVNLSMYKNEVVYADDRTVFVLETAGKFKWLVKINFDEEGLVLSVSCLSLSPMKSWEVSESEVGKEVLEEMMERIAEPFAEAFSELEEEDKEEKDEDAEDGEADKEDEEPRISFGGLRRRLRAF